MSQPNEPKFEDDFDVDTDPADQYYQPEFEHPSIEYIAITKAWTYITEYNKETGMTSEKPNSSGIRQAYKEGFLEGFSHRFTTNDKVSE